MSTRPMIFPINARAARRLNMVPVNAMGHPIDASISHSISTRIGTPAIRSADVSGIGDYAHDFFNSPASRSRGVSGLGADDTDAKLNYAQSVLGMQGQVGTAKLYPDLMIALNQVYLRQVQFLPFVPKDWYSQVAQIQGSNGGILLFPIRATNFLGLTNSGVPAWVAQNADAWNMIADQAKAVIQKYMDGKIAEGRIAMAQFSSDETFWGKVRLAALRSAQIAVKVGGAVTTLMAPKKTLLILAGIVVVGIIAWKNPQLFRHAHA